MATQDITPIESTILTIIEDNPGCTAKRIANALRGNQRRPLLQPSYHEVAKDALRGLRKRGLIDLDADCRYHPAADQPAS